MQAFLQDTWAFIARTAAAVGGFFIGLYGGADATMGVLLLFMAVDFATGLVVGLMGKSHKTDGGGLSSQTAFAGIGKKVLILFAVLIAAQLDRLTGLGDAAFRSMACWFYIAGEALSTLENLALAGVPIPAALKSALEQTRAKGDGGEQD